MINRNKIVVFVAFLGTLFFMTMFAGGTTEPQRIVTRNVTFKDGVTNEELSNEIVELGKSVRVPLVPEHEELEFDGWYTEEGERVTDFSEILADMTLTTRFRDLEPIEDEEEIEDIPIVTPPIRRPLVRPVAPSVVTPPTVVPLPDPTPEPDLEPIIPPVDQEEEPTDPEIILSFNIVDGEGNFIEEGKHVNPNLLPGKDLRLLIESNLEYKLTFNGELLEEITEDFSIKTFKDGEYVFVLENEVGDFLERKIIIDRKRPIVTVVSPELNSIYRQSNFGIDMFATDEYELEMIAINVYNDKDTLISSYSLNLSGKYDIASRNISDLDLSEGDYYFRIIARDKAGNLSQTVFWNFIIDKTRPIVEVISPNNDSSFNNNDFSINIKATDENMLGSVTLNLYSIDNILISPFNNPLTGKEDYASRDVSDLNLLNGDYYFRIIATDKAGNLSQTSFWYFTIDKTAPTLKLMRTDGYEIRNDSYINLDNQPEGILRLVAADNNLFDIYLNEDVIYKNISSSSIDVSSYLQEEGTYVFYAIDKANNSSNKIIVTVDKTPPHIQVGDLEKNIFENNIHVNPDHLYEKTILIEGKDNSGNYIIYPHYEGTELDKAPRNEPLFQRDLKEGLYMYYVGDLAGNKSSKFELIVDRTAPDIPKYEILGWDKGREGYEVVTLRFISRDKYTSRDEIKFEVSEGSNPNGYKWKPVDAETTFRIDSYKSMVVRAIDKAGNVSKPSEPFRLIK